MSNHTRVTMNTLAVRTFSRLAAMDLPCQFSSQPDKGRLETSALVEFGAVRFIVELDTIEAPYPRNCDYALAKGEHPIKGQRLRLTVRQYGGVRPSVKRFLELKAAHHLFNIDAVVDHINKAAAAAQELLDHNNRIARRHEEECAVEQKAMEELFVPLGFDVHDQWAEWYSGRGPAIYVSSGTGSTPDDFNQKMVFFNLTLSCIDSETAKAICELVQAAQGETR